MPRLAQQRLRGERNLVRGRGVREEDVDQRLRYAGEKTHLIDLARVPLPCAPHNAAHNPLDALPVREAHAVALHDAHPRAEYHGRVISEYAVYARASNNSRTSTHGSTIDDMRCSTLSATYNMGKGLAGVQRFCRPLSTAACSFGGSPANSGVSHPAPKRPTSARRLLRLRTGSATSGAEGERADALGAFAEGAAAGAPRGEEAVRHFEDDAGGDFRVEGEEGDEGGGEEQGEGDGRPIDSQFHQQGF
ncbi:hypothetical protein B0H11DRAFT_2422370 [Mycena galericulata]|nr:hypothetical protein B0H11DRAFT_2422370 [Mycena galericulata]